MKTRTRLYPGFGTQVLLAAVLGIGVLFGMAEVKRQLSFVIERDTPAITNARQLSKLIADMGTVLRGFVITVDEEFLETDMRRRIEEIRKDIEIIRSVVVKSLEQREINLAQTNTNAQIHQMFDNFIMK